MPPSLMLQSKSYLTLKVCQREALFLEILIIPGDSDYNSFRLKSLIFLISQLSEFLLLVEYSLILFVVDIAYQTLLNDPFHA